MPETPQGRYWILTIPQANFNPLDYAELPPSIQYITGQLEQPRLRNEELADNHSRECVQHNDPPPEQWDCICWVDHCPTHGRLVVGELGRRELQGNAKHCEPPECLCPTNPGFTHWQLVVGLKSKCRLRGVKQLFCPECHAEPTKSARAIDYVHKDSTYVPGTRFTLGTLPISRGRSKDWDRIRDDAKCGRLDDIPGDVYVRLYGNIKRIATDHMRPTPIVRQIVCYWGATGVGKSRRAWDEAGFNAFPKDPRTKFWDGYAGQEHVVIDEFRGGIDIAHVLRWFDRYPVVVEVKGSSVVLKATHIWITSNLPPEEWYPALDRETTQALLRRLDVQHMQ